MAEALYRKYRPRTFSDVVGQEHIERTLQNAIEQNKVSHAYLFCGPRGTGKTTTARILAKALLCEKAPTINPDGTCEECVAIANGTHPDVYELDAASRTGVENVREEIIGRVSYAPTRGAYKIYIIDEVHMLSSAAFNALLKTLEEPPSHVIFVLCTTDPQKVPETIHSRCQRFDFHRLSVDEIVTKLGSVCASEGVEFDAEALELIAHQADGGMRNALTSLEQLIAFDNGKVTLEGAQSLLGHLDDENFSDIVAAIGQRDAAQSFTWVATYVETGADLAQFVGDLAQYVRNLYLLSVTDAEVEISVSSSMRSVMIDQLKYFGPDRLSRLMAILGDLMKELRVSSNPRLSFEIALTKMLRPESDLTLDSLAERIERLEEKLYSSPQIYQADHSAEQSVAPIDVQSEVTPANHVVAQVQAAQPAASKTSSQPPIKQAAQQQQSPARRDPELTYGELDGNPAQNEVASSDRIGHPQRSDARLNLEDPAALQRFWQQVTRTLRQEKPAYGVLLLGAQIKYDPQTGGIQLIFSENSAFAFAAAQKQEVRDLLAQTLNKIAGCDVPFVFVKVDSPSDAVQEAIVSDFSQATTRSHETPPQEDKVPLEVLSQAYDPAGDFVEQNQTQPLSSVKDQPAVPIERPVQEQEPSTPALEEEQTESQTESERLASLLRSTFGQNIKIEEL